jgi:CHAT domain-containing protein
MALTQKGTKWATVSRTNDWLLQQVRTLRAHLVTPDDAEPFDTAVAHGLYRELLAPVEPMLTSKRLLVSTSGALSELPLGLLIASPPPAAGGKGLRDLDWLILRHSIVTLPSVSSLSSLAVAPTRVAPRTALVAFGNPALTGPASQYLKPIPGTLNEIERLSASLGAAQSQVYLGDKALEGTLKALNLSKVRILEFATHALLAGQWHDSAEPGLVFSTPATSTNVDDGYLTNSEAARLQLDADVVILSACNTASADGSGGDSLSGLALAFLYAGGRTVLASNWEINDAATSDLVVGAMSRTPATAPWQVADALAEEMRAMIKDTDHPTRADPYFWAPFVVVGGR